MNRNLFAELNKNVLKEIEIIKEIIAFEEKRDGRSDKIVDAHVDSLKKILKNAQEKVVKNLGPISINKSLPSRKKIVEEPTKRKISLKKVSGKRKLHKLEREVLGRLTKKKKIKEKKRIKKPNKGKRK